MLASIVRAALCLGISATAVTSCSKPDSGLVQDTAAVLAQVDSTVTVAAPVPSATAQPFEPVAVDESQLAPLSEDTLKLQLQLGRFGVQVANLVRYQHSPIGAETWEGFLQGPDGSPVVIVRLGRRLYATLQTPDGDILRLTSLGGEGQVVEELVDRNLPPELPPASPLSPVVDDGEERGDSCRPQEIDILAVYFPSRLGAMGGLDEMKGLISTVLGFANASLKQSGVDHTFYLLSVAPIPERPGNDFHDLFDAMRDGRIPGLRRLRDSVGADLVVLWMPEGTHCGMAAMLDAAAGGRPDDVYAVVSSRCAISTWTLAHELGHLLGAAHDRATADTEPPPNVPARRYGYGYRDRVGQFRDIMAYRCPDAACDDRFLYYSTPRKTHNQRPLGIDFAVIPDSAADVARMFQSTACTVAKYRSRRIPTPQPPVP